MTEEELFFVLSYGDKDYIPVDTFLFNNINVQNRCIVLTYSNKTNDKQLEIFINDVNSFKNLVKLASKNTNLIEQNKDYVDLKLINTINLYVSDIHKEYDSYKMNLFNVISLENINAKYYENGKLIGLNYSIVPFINGFQKTKEKQKTIRHTR